MNNEIYNIIGRQLAGEANELDSQKLCEWLNEDAHNKMLYQALSQYWINKREVTQDSKKVVFTRLKQRIKDTEKRGKLGNYGDVLMKIEPNSILKTGYWKRVAAIALLALGAGWITYEITSTRILDIEYVQNINAAGQKSTIFLSDGSKVTLNSESSLSYPKKFVGNERLIKLEGEAFFDVKRDPKKPFIVETGGLKTTVLGTSFNINAYSKKNTFITVATGKVQVTNDFQNVLLNPEEQLIFDSDKETFTTKKVGLESITDWKEGVINFDNTPMDEVVTILERWYGVSIVVENKAINSCTISGKFKEKKLLNVLKGIQFLLDIEYEILDTNQVHIIGESCDSNQNHSSMR